MEFYAKSGDWSKVLQFSDNFGKNYRTKNIKNFIEDLKKLATEYVKNRTENLMTQIIEWRDNLYMYTSRLEIVRDNKGRHLKEWLEQEGDDFQDLGQSEALSEASTTLSKISRLSKMSTASAKKRKQVIFKE